MKKFETNKRENFNSKQKKILFNIFPAYRRTGARVCFISSDWKEVHIKLALKWSTKNYVGTVFGGSIYGALDPIYMVQLINILGKNYVVWDKAANIKFIKPIKKTVLARFLIADDLLNEIEQTINIENEMEINFPVQFEDEKGTVFAVVTKTIYIANKEFYKTKKLKV